MTYRFLTGSYAAPEDEGICRFAFDAEKGFIWEKAWTGFSNPSYILKHPHAPVLYSVEENSPTGAVRAWQIGDSLIPLSSFPSGGASPCHLSLSEDEKYLYVSNYVDGTLAVFSLDPQGRIGKMCDLKRLSGHGPNPFRQEGPHAHCSLETDGKLYLCDLGTDRIHVYRNEKGKLENAGEIALPAGSGPRHVTVCSRHPGLLYCVAELESSVYVISLKENGKIVQSLSTLPAGFEGENTSAAIHISSDGRFLLASNRGHDSIAVYAIQADGALSQPVVSPCIAEPRDFILFDHFVVAGSQKDDLLRAYRLNETALVLEETPWSAGADCPVCFAAL